MWRFLMHESTRGWLAASAAVVAFAATTLAQGFTVDPSTERFMLSVAVFQLVYVVTTLVVFLNAPEGQIAEWAKRQKPSARRPLLAHEPAGRRVGAVLRRRGAGGVADGAAQTGHCGQPHPTAVLAVAVLMVFLSWVAVAVTQSLDYLVSPRPPRPRALAFPGTEATRYSDYLYLAVGVSASFAPTDVQVRSSVIRRRMTIHTLVAFVFSTLILASVVSALVGSFS